jgi:hypothetical protein
MCRPSVVTIDAGQAYESLRQPFISYFLDFLFRWAGLRGKQDPTISVFHGTRCTTRTGGRVIDRLYDRTVFWLSKLKKSAHALIAMRVFVMGTTFVIQTNGIPIGGPISGIILGSCLSVLEYNADTVYWTCIQAALGLVAAIKREHLVATIRYADDTLGISAWFCPLCLQAYLLESYKPEVPFEPSTESHNFNSYSYVRFLDFWVVCTWESVTFSLVCKNEVSTFFGGPKCKQRFPADFGHKPELYAKIKRDLQGRIARLRQIGATGFDARFVILCDIIELCQAGFRVGAIEGLWKSMPLHDIVFQAGIEACV